jgi:PRTRC genetic system protein A
MSFVEHHFVTGAETPLYRALLYDYIVGSNGVFLRSQREGLEVTLPVQPCVIRGLAEVEPMVQFAYRPVPAALMQYVLDCAQAAHDEEGRLLEILFHLSWDLDHWELTVPEQRQTTASVVPLDDGPQSSYAKALIELHSHHDMPAFFSGTDDHDEQGFRIYAVLGRISSRPELLVRVGCQGVHMIIPASLIFDLPEGTIDASLARHDDEEEEQDREGEEEEHE